jgi:hypothetical protein
MDTGSTLINHLTEPAGTTTGTLPPVCNWDLIPAFTLVVLGGRSSRCPRIDADHLVAHALAGGIVCRWKL